MSAPLRLVIFDVDGTLVDSQNSIVSAMTAAFQTVDLEVPGRADILSIVGLSLDHAMARLVPGVSDTARAELVTAYKNSFMSRRTAEGAAALAPLYPGAAEVLTQLQAIPEMLLGVATGKSQRGLDKLIEAHGWEQTFLTRQVADHHPSKPHPSMIHAAMDEMGVGPEDTVMIGDTSFDMDMAHAAGVPGIGVGWGYHDKSALGRASRIIDRFEELPGALDEMWSKANV